ncbi:TraB/GumN family protein [Allorhizobium undicola]|uniref:TraB/GumN family protein n=1 Tax=Allorhizobium undicola TaxID=78527 RepID=UPI003D33B820
MPRKFDRLLTLAAAFPLVLLLLLVSTLLFALPAHAQEVTSCQARNLLPEEKANNPRGYAELEAIAKAIPNGDHIFWKVEKPGHEPSWLLGTMHITDPRVTAMPPAARDAFADADSVVLESDEILDPKEAAIALFSKAEYSTFVDGTTLTALLSPEDLATVNAALKPKGLSVEGLNRMKPWLVASVLSLPSCEVSRKNKGALFLDMKLAVQARKAGKEVLGVETLAEQFDAMNKVPLERHIKSLVGAAKSVDKINDAIETMINLYLEGQIGMIMPALGMLGAEVEGSSEFEKLMILDRNRIMADRGAVLLDRGNVFMAVGALHLPGEGGVIELLRKKGFTVTPVS